MRVFIICFNFFEFSQVRSGKTISFRALKVMYEILVVVEEVYGN